MRVQRILACVSGILALSATLWAGPPLACHEFATEAGSVFVEIEQLRRAVMHIDQSANGVTEALHRLETLRAAVREDDPLSLLKAGYWAELLLSLRVAPDTGGRDMILKAMRMRPNDPEYRFIAALASFDRHRSDFHKYWSDAVKMARPGSAAARNLEAFGRLLL